MAALRTCANWWILLDVPITNTLMGLGAYPATDKRFLGMLGMHGTYTANMAMHNSDCILALGSRFDDRVNNNTKMFCPQAKIIHVDIDAANISKTVNAHVPIVGPVKQVIRQMIEQLKEKKFKPDNKLRSAWWSDIAAWRKKAPLGYEKAAADALMKPQQAVEILYEATKDLDAVITSDVGQHQMFVAQYYHFDNPNRWINSGGLGTMGFWLSCSYGRLFCFAEESNILRNW